MAFGARLVRAGRIAAKDPRIPRPLKVLLIFGALPIPGPFDEAVLLVGGAVLYAFYRRPMREAWHESA